ncbi:MAG: ribosome maturation factor RimP [Holosporales bacterium]|jgi:ribosome maturation factor RimP|nr:ribosome maturation factor RimP [Holosporales bacterium]
MPGSASKLEGKIEKHIEHLVHDLGYSIARVAITGSPKSQTIQVMIERKDGNPVTVEDCAGVSRLVSPAIEVLNPFRHRYNLEISSTGIDRPLMKPADFERFTGSYVIIRTYEAKGDRKIFKGMLDSTSESGVKLRMDDESDLMDIGYNEIKFANIDGERLTSF